MIMMITIMMIMMMSMVMVMLMRMIIDPCDSVIDSKVKIVCGIINAKIGDDNDDI